MKIRRIIIVHGHVHPFDEIAERIGSADIEIRVFPGGFPQPTRGDKIGIVVDKDKYQFLTEIAFGPTIILPMGHECRINKHVYDHIGIGPRQDPFHVRELPLLTALYEQVVVWEDNLPPQPLIRGKDHGQDSERTAFLVAILDKNGNGELDREDEIGYYGKNAIEVISGVPVEELPENIEIFIPSWFSGILTLPTPVKRIEKGYNQELRKDGTAGPHWIGNFSRVP